MHRLVERLYRQLTPSTPSEHRCSYCGAISPGAVGHVRHQFDCDLAVLYREAGGSCEFQAGPLITRGSYPPLTPEEVCEKLGGEAVAMDFPAEQRRYIPAPGAAAMPWVLYPPGRHPVPASMVDSFAKAGATLAEAS